jgi:hypothetical protein
MAAHPAASLRYKIAAHPGGILELQNGEKVYCFFKMAAHPLCTGLQMAAGTIQPYTGTEDLKYQEIDQSVRMNVKPEEGGALLTGQLQRKPEVRHRAVLAGRTDNVLCITVITDHQR